jgi:hypothetical protein
MLPFNLLLVEDNENEVKTFQDTLDRYRAEKSRVIALTVTMTRDDTLNALNNEFDGAIVDIKLKEDADAGNRVIDAILDRFRIPVVAYTANPSNVSVESGRYIRIFPRASVSYDEPLDFLFDMYNTGLTRIFGGRGYIEEMMNTVFQNIVDKELDGWKAYNAKGKNTEKALLRIIISHIVTLIDDDVEKYLPEEMYIFPGVSKPPKIKTGCIVRKKGTEETYVVLNPACDLAQHDGKSKTDRVLICYIEPIKELLEQKIAGNAAIQVQAGDDPQIREQKEAQKAKLLSEKHKVFSQNKWAPYYHYLPKTKAFSGGVINFRYLQTLKWDEYEKSFDSLPMQISSAFTKDIVARFSSYYARQGQPDFDLDDFLQ